MHVGSEIFDRARSCFVHLETVILFMLRVITRPRFARSMAAYYRGSNYKRGGSNKLFRGTAAINWQAVF